MQALADYNSNLGRAVLLIGPPGGGKSVLGCRLFPATYVLVADLNFESPKNYLAKINETANVVGFDTTDIDDKGVPVPLAQRYARIIRCLDEAEKNPAVGTIFIDSATFLADSIMAKLTGAASIDTIKWDKDKAGDYLRTWRSMIHQLRLSGKRLVMSAHEKIAKGEMDSILFYQLNLWGGLRDTLPNMMSDVWRCEVHAPAQLNGKPEYKVRVVGDARNKLKNNFGWDTAVMPSDEIVKQTQKTTTK